MDSHGGKLAIFVVRFDVFFHTQKMKLLHLNVEHKNFRRVDEIKLCVAAAKHIKQREEEMV